MKELFALLESSLLEGDAVTEPSLRRAIADHARAVVDDPVSPNPLEGPLGIWTDKVIRHAHRTVDDDVTALVSLGLSQDAIFEVTLAAAYGAAKGRYDRAMKAIEGDDDE